MIALIEAPPRSRRLRASALAHRQAVLDAALRLIARGEAPTVVRLGEEAGLSRDAARVWRRRLVDEGALVFDFDAIRNGPKPGGATTCNDGLIGDTAAELKQIEANYRAELARKREQHDRVRSELCRPRIARIVTAVGPAAPVLEAIGRRQRA